MCGTLNLFNKHSVAVGKKTPLTQLKSIAYTSNNGPVDVSTWNYYFVSASDFTGKNALDGAVIQLYPDKEYLNFKSV